MPYVADGPDGRRWVANNGATFGLAGGVGASGTQHVPGKQLRVDKMAATGLYEDGKKGIRRPGDPHLRIKEMDRDGVDAEVIYGILAAAAKLNDREASNEMLRIYNTWLNDFCSHYPDRHIGLACLPYGDIDAAVAEVHRVAKLGFKGIELSCSWDMEPMWHPTWEPLWEAINEVGIPLHFHTFPSVSPKLREQYTGLTQRALAYSALCLFQMTLANILTALMGRAVFERYPNVRIAFGESGIGWIPYVLDRMDFEYEDQYKDLPLKLKPSEYWRRQCKATFQYDRVGTKLIDEMGGGDPDVGLRLSASGRRVAGVGEVHHRAVLALAGRRDPEDDLRERGTVLRPDQLSPPPPSTPFPPPGGEGWGEGRALSSTPAAPVAG
jgi:predicted TIM-barrel fold metal-dependent hydrolase